MRIKRYIVEQFKAWKYSQKYRIRFSMQNLQYNGGLLSCPAPLAGWIDRLLRILPAAR